MTSPENLNDYLDWFYDPLILLFEDIKRQRELLILTRRRLLMSYAGLAASLTGLVMVAALGVTDAVVLALLFVLGMVMTAVFVLVEG